MSDKDYELRKSLLTEGEKYISNKQQKDWKKEVDIAINGKYGGEELKHSLELIKALESGAALGDVRDMFNSQDHKGTSFRQVVRIVEKYSDRGIEFGENLREEGCIIEKNKKYMMNM